MSRLDSMIGRLMAQRACLDWVASAIGGLPGPVLEIGLGNGRTYDHLRGRLPQREIHVFDRWCHLGVATCGIQLSEFDGRPRIFDPDVYRILTGFLDRPIAGAELLRLDRNRAL